MDEITLKLCDIQGRLFELSAKRSYDSAAFIKTFMLSKTARALDSNYNRMQWAGEEYLLDEVAAEASIPISMDIFSNEVLYWCGYVYRYWHYYTQENSAAIYRQAPAETMKRNYFMFHTMDPTLAIINLKEIHTQKKRKS